MSSKLWNTVVVALVGLSLFLVPATSESRRRDEADEEEAGEEMGGGPEAGTKAEAATGMGTAVTEAWVSAGVSPVTMDTGTDTIPVIAGTIMITRPSIRILKPTRSTIPTFKAVFTLAACSTNNSETPTTPVS